MNTSAHDRPPRSPGADIPLGRLLYTSRCAEHVPMASRAAMVDEIAAISALNNRKRGLGGSLLHVDGAFIQVLEGPMQVLENVFEVISCDLRHQDVHLIDFSGVPVRLFHDWGMNLLSHRNISSTLRNDLRDARFIIGSNATELLRQLSRVLYPSGGPKAAAH